MTEQELFEAIEVDVERSPTMGVLMKATCENSPWHREESVWVHTQMLLSWYKENRECLQRTDRQKLYSKLGCLFHDVGKPPARIEKYSEERGTYYAYHGHELISSRMWVDYAAKNHKFITQVLSPAEIALIAQMIHHHVPFNIVKAEKMRAMRQSITSYVGEDGHTAWVDMLLSDQHGRISDDQTTKLAAVRQWFTDYSVATAAALEV